MMISGCSSNNQLSTMPTPESSLLVEPCKLDTSPVTNSDEDLMRDKDNWSCASTWLMQAIGWQAWYSTIEQHKENPQ